MTFKLPRLIALLALLLTTTAFQDCRNEKQPTFRDPECKRQSAKVRDRLCYD